jgi:hypothetical protein
VGDSPHRGTESYLSLSSLLVDAPKEEIERADKGHDFDDDAPGDELLGAVEGNPERDRFELQES